MLPFSLAKPLESALAKVSGKAARIELCQSIGGGSINEACRLEWAGESYFVKWNSVGKFPQMFEKEAAGLKILKETGCIKVPEVLAMDKSETDAFLLLEFIQQSGTDSGFWNIFGKQLADLHRNSNSFFGLETDNYIGSLPQNNDPLPHWSDFFVQRRLHPLVKMARDNQQLDRSHNLQFEKLYSKIESLFPGENPALLHGDLWSGNFLCAKDQKPVLIDPAVYFGHREMDIAMSKLFGGFDRQFYLSYNEHFPMEKGWEKRIDLCNLYPLLVHLCLFGASYLYDIEATLRYYV
ncbi:MAG: fructosamine kinase family protein [Bacteroidales bacterium]